MKKRLIVVLTPLLMGVTPVLADPNPDCANLEALEWVLGSWRSQVGNNTFMEHWSRQDENLFVGHAQAVDEDGGATNFENLKLYEEGGTIVYEADVPQNPAPVPFRLTRCTSTQYRFENLAHDFPQIIVYDRLDDGRIQAHIMTDQEDGFKLMFEPYDGGQ